MSNKARFINTEKIDWDIDGNFPVYTRDYFRITGASQKAAEWDTDVVEKDGTPEEAESEDRYAYAGTQNGFDSFEAELRHVISKWSREQESGTPDFILANYLAGCLTVLDGTLQNRAAWRGEQILDINMVYGKVPGGGEGHTGRCGRPDCIFC